MNTSGPFEFLLILLVFLFSGCANQETGSTSDVLRLRLRSEPDRLNPMLSRTTFASQIEKYLFLPLQDYDPHSLDLRPVLLESKPEIEILNAGNRNDSMVFNLRIRDDAMWDNSTPVTGYDYLFTYKLAINPFIEYLAWKNLTFAIADIVVDSLDPKAITVSLDQTYILAEEVVTGFNVYPEHVYDPKQVLRQITFSDLRQIDPSTSSEVLDSIRLLNDQFHSVRFSRDVVIGCGPYRLVNWTANQQLLLEKKENWWGSSLNHPLVVSNPDQIIYHFIPDEQTAISNLKDGNLDIAADLSAEGFQQLRTSQSEHNLTLLNSKGFTYLYIGLNNAHPVLSDVLVRRALAHLVDVELLCNELFYGLAQPATGPIHPNSDYYRNGYKPISFDPEKSITLLNESGWQDSNNNGIRDKVINGKLTELAFGIKITRSQLSQDVAILLKSQAAEVGIEIEILPQDFSVTLTQIRNRDYELAALSSIQSPSLYDPYPTWHSHNANPTGSNYCQFMDEEADEIIETLRQSVSDSSTIRRLYNDLQQIIYERQPAIFLVSPTINLALRTNLKLESLKIRPGYYENLVVFD